MILQEIKKNIKLYFFTLKMQLNADMTYKFDFFNEIIRVLMGLGAVFILVQIIFLNTNEVNGVSKLEMYLIFGLISLSFTLYRLIFGSIGEISWGIKDGYLDYRLFKPVNPLISYTFFNTILSVLPDLAGNLGLVLYAFYLGEKVSIFEILLGLTFSILLYFAVYLFIQTLNFYTLFPNNATNLTESIFQLARLPLNFYPFLFRVFFSYVLPLSITGSYIIYVNNSSIPKYLYINIAVVIFALLYFSIKFWNYSLKRYTGASS